MSADRRFDALREAHPEAFDVQAAADRWVADAARKAATPGAELSDHTGYGRALVIVGRIEEGVAVYDAALADLDRPRKPGEAMPDPDDVIWLLDSRSRARRHLGDVDGSLADLRRAARRPENGQVNVSHAINLGALYLELDRPADALDAVLDVTGDRVSPFGRLQLSYVRACAHAALGDGPRLKTELAYISDNAADAPSEAWSVFSCIGDQDAAAALLISQLEDPETRMSALQDVQFYATPTGVTPGRARDSAFLDAVVSRPDVSAAIDGVGRRDRWPLIAPGF